MKNEKMIVWDLFGGGQNSVYQTLKENDKLKDFEVYTFDVTEPTREHHYKIDLAQENIVEVFKQFPKPDVIVSSTLCQSFSCVLNMKGGGTCFWKLNETKDLLIQRSVEEFELLKNGFTKNCKADVQLFIAKLGKKCIDNTIALIQHYQPKFWYIENPKSSLIWKYITLNRTDFYNPETCFLNEASYGKYGYVTTKATNFLSNVKMDLLKGKIDSPYSTEIDKDGVEWLVLNADRSCRMKKTMKSGVLAMSSVNKLSKINDGTNSKVYIQKNKMVNEQISEAGPSSAIPHNLIMDIFKYFK